MIIDLILDRKDDESSYNPHDFYVGVMRYINATPKSATAITLAMDGGTNADVQNALCEYIDWNGYNPHLKSYIRSKEWI